MLNSKRKLQKWLSESINVKIEELLKVLVTGAGSVLGAAAQGRHAPPAALEN